MGAYRTACNLPEDTFKELMKTGLEPAMDAFSQVPGWNGDKCPAFRHIKYGEARTSGASTKHVLSFLTSKNCVRHCYFGYTNFIDRKILIGNFIFQFIETIPPIVFRKCRKFSRYCLSPNINSFHSKGKKTILL